MSENSFIGNGWSFPPTFDNADYFRLQISGGAANICQSIDMILQTARGSRTLTPGFGSNLSQFLFRTMDTSLCSEVVQAVKTALLLNEPRITVDAVTSTIADDQATILLNIEYTINNVNTRGNHVYPFCVLEGTNLPLAARG